MSRTVPSRMPTAHSSRGMIPLMQPKSTIKLCSLSQTTARASRICPSRQASARAVGGLIFAVVLFVLVGVWVPMSIHYSQMIIYCILASVVGQFGDLCMSCVKRICGVKDFGKIFPGHGGILDRFDSQLLVIPFTVLYLYVTDGFIL